MKYNNWEILEIFKGDGTQGYGNRKLCSVLCDCGEICIRRYDHVINGRTKRCKKCSSSQTLKDHPNPLFTDHPHKGYKFLTKTFFNSYIYKAKERGLEFNITVKDAWDKFEKQEYKCALSGVYLTMSDETVNNGPDYKNTTASLDRIDSDKGYTIDNIQWVHKDINFMKGDLPEWRFREWCEKITNTCIGGVCGS